MGSEEIFQLLNYKGISELLFFDAIPSLKLSFNPQQAAASESLNRPKKNGCYSDRRINAECPEFKQVQVSDKIFCMQ